MAASKRTHVLLETTDAISPCANNDDFLCVAFACYGVNPAIRRTCKTLDAYFAMSTTIGDLAAQGALGGYELWEYRAFKFDTSTLPRDFESGCKHCHMPSWDPSGHDVMSRNAWPVPFGSLASPPMSSRRLLRLFKYLVGNFGLYYFCRCHRRTPAIRMCACRPLMRILTQRSQLAMALFCGDSLHRVIATKIPSRQCVIRHEFVVNMVPVDYLADPDYFDYFDDRFFNIRIKTTTAGRGSPVSVGLSQNIHSTERPFHIDERPFHGHYFQLLDLYPKEPRPLFATDTMEGYLAYFILQRMGTQIPFPHYQDNPRDADALSLAEWREYISNATLSTEVLRLVKICK